MHTQPNTSLPLPDFLPVDGVSDRVYRLHMAREPRFVCDTMLGRLTRWLRYLGADTLYARSGTREALHLTLQESRVLLTRNRRFFQHHTPPSSLLLLDEERTDAQLRQVLQHHPFPLRPGTRCLVCNTPLTPLSREEVRGRVPFFVFQTAPRFQFCPTCGRITWPGSHTRHLDSRIQKALQGLEVRFPS